MVVRGRTGVALEGAGSLVSGAGSLHRHGLTLGKTVFHSVRVAVPLAGKRGEDIALLYAPDDG